MNKISSALTCGHLVTMAFFVASLLSGSSAGAQCSPPYMPLPDADLHDAELDPGQSYTYYALVMGGTQPMYYQWFLNGQAIPGATNASYTIVSAQATDAGNYQVLVTNACGRAETLTNWPYSNGRIAVKTAVGDPPTITSQPQSQEVATNQMATFTVVASGSAPLTYTWRFVDEMFNVFTSNGPSITIANAQNANDGLYSVLVSNAYGSVTSSIVNLWLVAPPMINTQPADQMVLVTGNASFSVDASGNRPGTLHSGLAPSTYQWHFNGQDIAGATNSVLTLQGVEATNAGSYAVMVTNPAGSTNSQAAALDVRYAVFRANGTLLTGTSYTFSGGITLSVQSGFTNGSIFYTLDGSAPTFASSRYTGPFTLGNSARVRALTYSADFNESGEGVPVNIRIAVTNSLTVQASGGGSVSLSPPGGLYQAGSSVSVMAQPAPGWTFLYWLGAVQGTNPSTSVILAENKTIKAVFGTTLSTTVAGQGSLSLSPLVPYYAYGSTVQVMPNAAAGYYFGAWGNAASGSANPLLFTVTNANPIISSLFAPLGENQAALSVTTTGAGRVQLSPAASVYATGGQVSLMAVPGTGQNFLGWRGDASGSANPLSITLNQSMSIAADFSSRPVLSFTPPLDGTGPDGLRFTISSQPDTALWVQVSSNLSSWTVLGTVTNFQGRVQFVDPGATNRGPRFYRTSGQ